MKRELRELIVLLLDAYKLFHRQMYPNNTITVYSNATPRRSKHYKGNQKGYVISFGQQRLAKVLKDKFAEFFALPEEEVINFCREQISSFTGAEYDVDHLIYLHRLQKLPLIIKAIPEGMRVPIGIPYMTMYNTDPRCYWLTNYLETMMSSEIWPLITNATIASEYNDIFSKWSSMTTGSTDFVPFQGHDFSMRGMFGVEAARMSGLAHLTSFCGSDTVPSYLDAQYYYDVPQNDWTQFPKGIIATSVPATEHSVQCAHYRPEDGDELAYLDHILETFPTGIVSIVCDGFDFWNFITKTLPKRKDVIMARDGKVVVRPDSGNPADIICGMPKINGHDQYYYDSIPNSNPVEYKGAVEILWDIFGGTTNDLGYKELDSHIGLIYGDAISLDRAETICERLASKGFASTNWVAGIGSYTYQFNTRDSHGQAFKATYCELAEGTTGTVNRNGSVVEMEADRVIGKAIYKDPKTGDGTKKSAKGLLAVHHNQPGVLTLNDEVDWAEEGTGMLQTIFKDGELQNTTTLFEIRDRIRN